MKRSVPSRHWTVIAFVLLAAPAGAAERYPLGPGMRWTYRRAAVSAPPVEVSVEVTGALGAGVFQLATPGSDDSTLVQVEGEKVYSVVSGPAASLRTLVLDFERVEGESWTLACDGEVLIESTGERVEVPAGVFEGCWRVRTSMRCLPGLGPATVWYAPGVGRVKSELDGPDGPVKEELTGFRPLGAFTRGDSNRDRKVDLSDAVFTLRWLFLGEAEPDCQESADSDRDGAVSLTDAVYLLRHLFLAGLPPAPPFPECRQTDMYELACEAGVGC